MAPKKNVGSLKEADLKGRRVLVRVDLNVPLDDDLNIKDDARIRAAVPTIKYLMNFGAKVILCSHLSARLKYKLKSLVARIFMLLGLKERPNGVTPNHSLRPLVPRLSEFLGVEVIMANDCIGEEVRNMVAEVPEGGVLLLENVRFHKEEEKNDPAFAQQLASLADLYVNDAYGGFAHRAHASTEGVARYLNPAVAGFRMQKIQSGVFEWVDTPIGERRVIAKMSQQIECYEKERQRVKYMLIGSVCVYVVCGMVNDCF